jgi:hypothetical protein
VRTCLNGHEVPNQDEFCGPCGAPVRQKRILPPPLERPRPPLDRLTDAARSGQSPSAAGGTTGGDQTSIGAQRNGWTAPTPWIIAVAILLGAALLALALPDAAESDAYKDGYGYGAGYYAQEPESPRKTSATVRT